MTDALIQHIDTGVHIIDDRAQTIYYNTKMAEIEGMKPEDVLEKPIYELFSFMESEESTLYEALTKGKQTVGRRQTYKNQYGDKIATINDTFPVRSEQGNIVGAIELARDVTQLENLIQEHMQKRARTSFTFDHLIGESKALQEVIQDAKRATRTSSSVLIVGETGTGKEIFAQSIHTGSERSAAPFVAQNCAAIPDQLLESLLFGTKSGAFTGAKEQAGLFEQANGGTLLLDEINSLNTPLQAKLLRAIQEKRVRRVGDTKEKEVDVRIIATMNQDPVEAVNEGRLRKDLFYRLSVVSLFVPPLRERKEDIDELISFFITKYNQLFRLGVTDVSTGVLTYLKAYDWPGNVRELEHIIEGGLNFMDAGEKVLKVEHLPGHFKIRILPELEKEEIENENEEAIVSPVNYEEEILPLKTVLYEQERNYVKHALNQYNGNVSKTAEALGLSRQSLQYRLRKLNLNST
nr:sigma-54-dependent Fis family transcriptional regulator [Salsuginibacillus kocurii]